MIFELVFLYLGVSILMSASFLSRLDIKKEMIFKTSMAWWPWNKKIYQKDWHFKHQIKKKNK